jgi:hypothetical protein
MAIYHLHASTGSRKGGQSAAAKSDYIRREGKYTRDPSEVLASGSGNMPDFAADHPAIYWQAADDFERANGRLFKEVEFALPRELSLDQQQALVEQFTADLTAGEHLPYSYAIHKGVQNGVENPHCHLMISERKNDGVERAAGQWFKRFNRKEPERGGAEKTDGLKAREWLEQTRERWAQRANEALEQHGHTARIDHRSHAARKTVLIPQVHAGHVATAMERSGVATPQGDLNRQIKQANAEMISAAREIRSIDRQMSQIQIDAEAAKKAVQEAKKADPLQSSPSVKRKTAEIEEQRRETASAQARALDAESKLLDTQIELHSVNREYSAAQEQLREARGGVVESQTQLDSIRGLFKRRARAAATAELGEAQQQYQQAEGHCLDTDAQRRALEREQERQRTAARAARAEADVQEQTLAELEQQRSRMIAAFNRPSVDPGRNAWAEPEQQQEQPNAWADSDRRSHSNDGPELG